MLEETTGRFFHIDFGHFLNHAKQKKGWKRDREPFIFSKELAYFLTNFDKIKPRQLDGVQQLALN